MTVPPHRILALLALAAAGAPLPGCDANPGGPPLPPRDDCALVAIHSDYRSTSVSLLTADGAPCAPDLLDSGSQPAGLLNALSGDVVPASAPAAALATSGRAIALLDRYPAGVLTLLDADTDAVTHQVQLSAGFAGNPQDLFALGADLVLVSRLERAPVGATPAPAGGDLALFRLDATDATTAGGSFVGRLDLAPLAAPGFEPMPTRLALHEGALWVGLAHLKADFTAAGPGRIGRIAPPPASGDARQLADWLAAEEAEAVEFPGLENCVEVAPAEGGVWVVCAGSFRRGAAGQVARSGLAFVGADGEVEAAFGAAALSGSDGDPAPLGFTLAAVDAHRAVVVLLGDLVTGRPDRAVLVTRGADAARPESVTRLAEAPTFAFGDALLVGDGETLLLCDGDPVHPALLRIRLGEPSAPTRLPATSATGLPPRSLRPFSPTR